MLLRRREDPRVRSTSPTAGIAREAVSLVLRTRSDPAGLAGALRETVRGLDPGLPVDAVSTLDEVRARASWVARLWGRMLSQVAVLALVLATLGVYGIVSHMVSQRTNEIGIRMALGATRGDVVRLVVRQGARLALQAVAVGLLAALLLTGALSRLLYGVDARDPATLLRLRGCSSRSRRSSRAAPRPGGPPASIRSPRCAPSSRGAPQPSGDLAPRDGRRGRVEHLLHARPDRVVLLGREAGPDRGCPGSSPACST